VWLPARIILVHNASSRQFDSHEFHRLLTAKYEQSNFRGSESIGKSALRLVAQLGFYEQLRRHGDLGGFDQCLDIAGREVLAGATLGIRSAFSAMCAAFW